MTINRVVAFLSYPFSAAAGFLVAHTSVRDSAYEKAKSKDAFVEITEKFGTEHAADIALRKSESITQKEFLERAITNKRQHSQAVQERMEQLGIDKFTKKWEYINRGGKQKAIIEGLTIAGITVGALLTVASSKTLSRLFSGNSKTDEQSR